ncbi:MAG: aromatic amino acid transaminase [Gammaproteobacteria bacterium]|nr:aromatic amino acid transaminase [Gammaproteobacteria bacterium]
MFKSIKTLPIDPIFGLMDLFKKDARTNKINLTAGVYVDDKGKIPIFEAVKQAENIILSQQTSKNYLPICGDEIFREFALKSINTTDIKALYQDAIQTPGGTGALSVLAGLISKNFPSASMWLSDPTWQNHHNIFSADNINIKTYYYFDPSTNSINIGKLENDLRHSKPGDFILLHTSCHNPTGTDFNDIEQNEVLALVNKYNLIPAFDNAYQGFDAGFSEDIKFIHKFLANGVKLFVASSYSKNFGLYNERIGALSFFTDNQNELRSVVSNFSSIARSKYSNPPAHGSTIIKTIYSDRKLFKLWSNELSFMNTRINGMRITFADELTKKVKRDFSFIKNQKGLFSLLPISRDGITKLRDIHGIYLLDSGRINVAGLSMSNLSQIVNSIQHILQEENL